MKPATGLDQILENFDLHSDHSCEPDSGMGQGPCDQSFGRLLAQEQDGDKPELGAHPIGVSCGLVRNRTCMPGQAHSWQSMLHPGAIPIWRDGAPSRLGVRRQAGSSAALQLHPATASTRALDCQFPTQPRTPEPESHWK